MPINLLARKSPVVQKSPPNNMSQSVIRIGIDCRLLGPTHAGIGRYIQQLVTHLCSLSRHSELVSASQNLDLPHQITWIFFYSDHNQLKILKEICPQAEFHHTPIRHYSLAEQLKLPKSFNQANLDLLHVPHFNVPLLYRRPFVVTIHDLLWHEYKGSHVTTLSPLKYWFKYLFYRLVSNQAMTRSKAILVPSQAVANTILKILPSIKSKIYVTPEAASLDMPATKVNLLPENYWLYVGSLYPHKNVKIIFQALQTKPDARLVIASTRSVFADQMFEQARQLKVDTQITWQWGISDAELKYLYQKAIVLIQPSLSEGFGLTGLEAMSVGCPVACSDIPVFREVYDKSAIYFDPQQPKSLLSTIDKIVNSPSKWKALGRQHAQRFSWQKTAQLTWEVYRNILQNVK